MQAINGRQLDGATTSVAKALGGTTEMTDGRITRLEYNLEDIDGDGKAIDHTYDNVGDALGGINTKVNKNTGDINTINTNITNLGNGTIGLVQQDATTRNLTVGKGTDGMTVDFLGTAGARALLNVADGKVAAGSKDAVNGGQLFGLTSVVGDITTQISGLSTDALQWNAIDGVFSARHGTDAPNRIADVAKGVRDRGQGHER